MRESNMETYTQFSSHGTNIVEKLRDLYQKEQGLRPFFEMVFETVNETIQHLAPRLEILPNGFPLGSWLEQSEVISVNDHRCSTITLTSILIYHLCEMQRLCKTGSDVSALARSCSGVFGHSVGLMSGVVFSMGKSEREYESISRASIRYLLCLAYRSEETFLAKSGSYKNIVDGKSPMATIQKVTRKNIEAEILKFNSEGDGSKNVALGLSNADDINVLVGTVESLELFRSALLVNCGFLAKNWAYLDVTTPFHSVELTGVMERFEADREFIDFNFCGDDLLCPVFRTDNSENIQHDKFAFETCAELMCLNSLDWEKTLDRLSNSDVAVTVIDFGPGPLTKLFTQIYAKKNSISVRQFQSNSEKSSVHIPSVVSEKHVSLDVGEEIGAVIDAIIFAGQGSQKRGMGEKLFSKYPELVDEADDILGYSIQNLCLSDPDGLLNRTDYTQPAIYFVNALSALEIIENSQRPPFYSAGHSLGEFNALQIAGAFDIGTGLRLIKERGRLMHELGAGGMSVVIGLSELRLTDLLLAFGLNGLYVANVNTQSQIVLSGDIGQLDEAEGLLLASGAKKVVRLNTSGAFHSPMMGEAGSQFGLFLEKHTFSPLKLNVISNCTGSCYSDELIKPLLTKQITSVVRWYETIETFFNFGVNKFTEAGGSTILGRMIKEVGVLKERDVAKL